MVVRAVEGKLPYTGGKAIEITNRKVVNLRLRDENNLIIYDAGDNEIYADLQLGDEIRPSSEFPVGANVGRAIEDNGWETTGTLVCFKTTSGDNIKLLYADNGKLFIDNGTGTFKQIYLKSEVDALLALKQDLLTAGDNITIDENNVISATQPGVMEIKWDGNNNRWEVIYWGGENYDNLDGVVCGFEDGDEEDLSAEIYSNGEVVFEIVGTAPSSYVADGRMATGMLKVINNAIVFFPRQGCKEGQVNTR